MRKHSNTIQAYVLAGGDSRRMKRDKRLLRIDGYTFIDRVRILIRKVLAVEPFIVGDNLEKITVNSDLIINDAAVNKGPIAGLVSALEHCKAEWALVVAVDMPLLSANSLKKLLDAADAQYDVITLSSSTKPEPFAALYRLDTSQFWREQMEADHLSLRDGIKKLNVKIIRIISAKDGNELLNINTPEDLQQIEDFTGSSEKRDGGS